MLMLLKMLAAGQSQRHPSTLNGGFPPGSRNQRRQKHHEKAEARSITNLTRKAPTWRTAESPSTSQDHALHVCLQAAIHAGFFKKRNFYTWLGFWEKASGLWALQAGGKRRGGLAGSLRWLTLVVCEQQTRSSLGINGTATAWQGCLLCGYTSSPRLLLSSNRSVSNRRDVRGTDSHLFALAHQCRSLSATEASPDFTLLFSVFSLGK